MPRKTDGIEFEIHPRPTKGEDGKPLLYVRPAKGRKKSFKQLEDFCNKYRNLRTGELQMVFDVVIDVVGLWLSDGYRVETPIGSFAGQLLVKRHNDWPDISGHFEWYCNERLTTTQQMYDYVVSHRKAILRQMQEIRNRGISRDFDEASYFQDYYDEYLNDPEDEIRFPPEIFDANED